VGDAYRAYAYFRWVDDILDSQTGARSEKIAFISRQKDLLEACYRCEIPEDICIEELMLLELVRHDSGTNSGLQSYLRNMMSVMEFDAGRRGCKISGVELTEYSRALATAVTDAMFYFIGHDDPVPCQEERYLPVTAAHITHMLRDALVDLEAGYFNIPSEYLRKEGISPWDTGDQAYRKWVCGRAELARMYFNEGRDCLSQVRSLRCRLVCFAYTARFEWMLRAIQRDNYCLRSEYRERKSLGAGLWMGWAILVSMLASPWVKTRPGNLQARPLRIKD
jgi:phytoene/squalene synthetase